jgi:hypothetical protein
MEPVTWVDLEAMSFENTVSHKLVRLLKASGAAETVSDGMRVALKINTAEEGYDYGLRPSFIRTVVRAASRASNNLSIICDGQRLVDYWKRSKGNTFMEAASAGGYSNETLAGHFVINGGFSGDEGDLFPCGSTESTLGGVEVGTAICRSDALWVLSHVTLHPLFGISGALVNAGFECLSGRARTRLLQGLSPYVFNGVRPDGEAIRSFHMRALESIHGVRAAVNGRMFFINYLWDVTPQPEYYPFSFRPVVENLGFMASHDPVALDAATHDLMMERMGGRLTDLGVDYTGVLRTAESMGIGSLSREVRRFS